MKHLNFRNLILITIFLCFISFPIINSFFHLVDDSISFENRGLTQKPALDIRHLDPYPRNFENYYKDHFSLRSSLIKYYNYLNTDVFHKSPIPGEVVIGNNEWLFIGGKELDVYRGRNNLKQNELDDLKKELEARSQFLKNHNCKFYFMPVPVKAVVYPNNMPFYLIRESDVSWGEVALNYLKGSKANTINLYTPLKELANKHQLYYKLDNHWNALGALYGANEILKKIAKDFPDIDTINFNDLNISKTLINRGNIQNMISTSSSSDTVYQISPKSGFTAIDAPKKGYPCPTGFPSCEIYEERRETKNTGKPKILIISDSFGESLFPLLSEKFSVSVKIFDNWDYKLNEDIVLSEKPDIVLIMTLECHIRNVVKYSSKTY